MEQDQSFQFTFVATLPETFHMHFHHLSRSRRVLNFAFEINSGKVGGCVCRCYLLKGKNCLASESVIVLVDTQERGNFRVEYFPENCLSQLEYS